MTRRGSSREIGPNCTAAIVSIRLTVTPLHFEFLREPPARGAPACCQSRGHRLRQHEARGDDTDQRHTQQTERRGHRRQLAEESANRRSGKKSRAHPLAGKEVIRNCGPLAWLLRHIMSGRSMKSRRRRMRTPSLDPMTDLLLSSWETITHRTFLLLQGRCSAVECQKMVAEKVEAAALSATWLTTHPGQLSTGILDPWRRRATANARRLRKRSSASGRRR
jgi:hypothetical protein